MEMASSSKSAIPVAAVIKYKTAGIIVNNALRRVVSICQPKARIVDICSAGDTFIEQEMGCHIDGYMALAVHTYIVNDGLVTGRQADVLCAASTASEVIMGFVRPGMKHSNAQKAIQNVAEAYGCRIVNYCIRELEKYASDFEKDASTCVSQKDDIEFVHNGVYLINIVATTGEGKIELLENTQTTVYQRCPGAKCKPENLRPLFEEIEMCPIMPFVSRTLKLNAVQDLMNFVDSGVLHPYRVEKEQYGCLVARIQFTVVLHHYESDRITSCPVQELRPISPLSHKSKIETWLLASKNTSWIPCNKDQLPKSRRRYKGDIIYAGKLHVAPEGSGLSPLITDIAWAGLSHAKACGAVDCLACTGSLGTFLFRHSETLPDIENGWTKDILLDMPGKFCRWNTKHLGILAVAVVRESDSQGEVYVIDCKKNESPLTPIFEVPHSIGTGMSSLSWSSDGNFLLVTWEKACQFATIKRSYDNKKMEHSCWAEIHKVASGAKQDFIIGAFHPLTLCFVATDEFSLKFYRLSDEDIVEHMKCLVLDKFVV